MLALSLSYNIAGEKENQQERIFIRFINYEKERKKERIKVIKVTILYDFAQILSSDV